MKDLVNTPTPDLIAEWEQKGYMESKSPNHQHWRDRRHEIIDELDRRKDAKWIDMQAATIRQRVKKQ